MRLHERLREFSRMSLLIATFRLLDYLRATLWRTCSDKHRVSSDDKSAARKHAPHLWWCVPPRAHTPTGLAQRGARIELPFHTTASKLSPGTRLATARPSGLASR